MVDSQDLDEVRRYVAATIGSQLPEWPGGYPNEVEAALIDAVFSIRANYGGPTTGVRGVVARWRKARGSAVDDLSQLARTDGERLAAIVGNRAKASGRLKAEIVVDAAARLVATGLVHAEDLTGSDDQRSAYLSVHGCGQVTWAYFGMLLGHSNAKADTWVIRYVEKALQGRKVSSEEARQLVVAAAKSMSVPASQLDHAIWRYARSGVASG